MELVINDELKLTFSAEHWAARGTAPYDTGGRPAMVMLRCDYQGRYCSTPIVLNAPKSGTWCKDSIDEQTARIMERFKQEPFFAEVEKPVEKAMPQLVKLVKDAIPRGR